MYLKLIRNKPEGDALYGKLYITKTLRTGEQTLTLIAETLENERYKIPPLIYRLSVTFSPKFHRPLPLVNSVPGRSGIRFHPGNKPEHSHGCILVSKAFEDELKQIILREDTMLDISQSDIPHFV